MSKATKKAVKELAGIAGDRLRIKSLKQELEEMNARLYYIRGATLSDVPMRGGKCKQEDKIIDIVDDPERETIIRLIAEQEKRLELINEAIALLSPLEQRLIVEHCINRNAASIIKIARESNYSERQVNRILYAALSKYAHMRGLDARL